MAVRPMLAKISSLSALNEVEFALRVKSCHKSNEKGFYVAHSADVMVNCEVGEKLSRGLKPAILSLTALPGARGSFMPGASHQE